MYWNPEGFEWETRDSMLRQMQGTWVLAGGWRLQCRQWKGAVGVGNRKDDGRVS